MYVTIFFDFFQFGDFYYIFSHLANFLNKKIVNFCFQFHGFVLIRNHNFDGIFYGSWETQNLEKIDFAEKVSEKSVKIKLPYIFQFDDFFKKYFHLKS